MVLGLSLVSYWRFQKIRLAMPEAEFPALPKVKMPDMESEWQNTFFPESEEKEEWGSPDGKLKLEYSASWQEMDQTVLQHAEGTEILLTEAEILFFAYRFKVQEQASAFLAVSQTDTGKTLEEIMAEVRQNLEDEGGEADITVLETNEEVALLEMTLKYADQQNFHSKGKIIFAEEKIYLVFFASPQKDWLQLQEEADGILDSIHLMQ